MHTMIKGKIFLAEERGATETAFFRSDPVFCLVHNQPQSKEEIGNLYMLNDDTLGGGYAMNMQVQEDVFVLVLPVAGAVMVSVNDEDAVLVVAGQSLVVRAKAGFVMHFRNPFRDDPVNFLQCWFKPGSAILPGNNITTYEDVNQQLNRLVPVVADAGQLLPFAAAAGKFAGRGDTIYKTSGPHAAVFLFVLEGAFEAAGRLLHDRDGLALYDVDELEMEALSHDALILLIELPVTV